MGLAPTIIFRCQHCLLANDDGITEPKQLCRYVLQWVLWLLPPCLSPPRKFIKKAGFLLTTSIGGWFNKNFEGNTTETQYSWLRIIFFFFFFLGAKRNFV